MVVPYYQISDLKYMWHGMSFIIDYQGKKNGKGNYLLYFLFSQSLPKLILRETTPMDYRLHSCALNIACLMWANPLFSPQRGQDWFVMCPVTIALLSPLFHWPAFTLLFFFMLGYSCIFHLPIQPPANIWFGTEEQRLAVIKLKVPGHLVQSFSRWVNSVVQSTHL